MILLLHAFGEVNVINYKNTSPKDARYTKRERASPVAGEKKHLLHEEYSYWGNPHTDHVEMTFVQHVTEVWVRKKLMNMQRRYGPPLAMLFAFYGIHDIAKSVQPMQTLSSYCGKRMDL